MAELTLSQIKTANPNWALRNPNPGAQFSIKASDANGGEYWNFVLKDPQTQSYTYEKSTTPFAAPAGMSDEQLAAETAAGTFGNGDDRQKALVGRFAAIQPKVNEIYKNPAQVAALGQNPNIPGGNAGDGTKPVIEVGNGGNQNIESAKATLLAWARDAANKEAATAFMNQLSQALGGADGVAGGDNPQHSEEWRNGPVSKLGYTVRQAMAMDIVPKDAKPVGTGEGDYAVVRAGKVTIYEPEREWKGRSPMTFATINKVAQAFGYTSSRGNGNSSILIDPKTGQPADSSVTASVPEEAAAPANDTAVPIGGTAAGAALTGASVGGVTSPEETLPQKWTGGYVSKPNKSIIAAVTQYKHGA
jgi:hypothetical protein